MGGLSAESLTVAAAAAATALVTDLDIFSFFLDITRRAKNLRS